MEAAYLPRFYKELQVIVQKGYQPIASTLRGVLVFFRDKQNNIGVCGHGLYFNQRVECNRQMRREQFKEGLTYSKST